MPAEMTNPACAGLAFTVPFSWTVKHVLFLSSLHVSFGVFWSHGNLSYSRRAPLIMVHYSYDKIHTLDKIIYISGCREAFHN